MKDRFRYRVFDNDDRKMHDVIFLNYENNSVEWYNDNNKKRAAFIEKVPTLQCTGLKDKNGREICDGDILKFKLLEDFAAFGTNEKYVEIIAPVIYEYGGFFIEQSENSIFLGQLPMSEIEVVGNIYENPELLEVTNKIKENKEWK